MSVRTIRAAYAAFANNDSSVLFGAMAPDIHWYEAEGDPLADRNLYVGAQAIGEGVFGRLLGAIDGFTAYPIATSTAAPTSSCSAATAAP